MSAYLYLPAQATGPLPLVVFNRGSYVVKDQAPVLLATFRRIALEGFVVLAPMLRGSDGMEGRDEMGGADLHDIANAIVAARSLGNDPQVDVSHTLRLAENLKRAGTRFAVRIFDNDGHTLFRNRVERDRTATAFFEQFLSRESEW